jgi:hypothetical protein
MAKAARPNIIQRLARAVGESSALRSALPTGWGFQYISPYRLDSSRVDYALARELYRNVNDKYKLGAAFARPVIDSTAGFMGVPHFTHPDPEAARALEDDMARWTGKLLQINRDALRDGDVFVRLARAPGRFDPGKHEEFGIRLVPPEWVTPVIDPITGRWQQLVIRYPVTVTDAQGRRTAEYTLTETLTDLTRAVEADGRAPAEIRAGNKTEPNPWGFIPFVHFRNEGEETQLYGTSDLEPMEPFMRAYHDTMLFAVQGSKYFSRPKVKFQLRDVQKFLADNFSAEEISAGKLKFADKEIFMLQDGDNADFISADSGLTGITTLLKFIFMCIVDVSQTPEFAFGTAVSSSKASVSEQMVPLARKIRRKRGMFEEPYGDLAAMYLAMWCKVNNRALDAYQASIGWDELSPRNDQEVATTIKTLVEGLTTGVEGGLLSGHAGSEFLREFIPSMLPWIDPGGDDDERRRVAQGFLLRKRLEDGGDVDDDAGGAAGQAQESGRAGVE